MRKTKMAVSGVPSTMSLPKITHRIQYSYGIIAFTKPKTHHSSCPGLLLPHKLPKCDICYEKLPICFKTPKHHTHSSPWSVLLIQRRQTMAYYDFLRAHYLSVSNSMLRKQFVRILISEMTCEERAYLETNSFTQLWKREQSYNIGTQKYQYRLDRLDKCFNELNIPLLLEETPSRHYATAEFGFPKGKAKSRECAWRTATREFCEETGYSLAYVQNMKHKGVVVEEFVATNGIPYRHLYYVMEFTEQAGNVTYSRRNSNQYSEVQNMFWCPVDKVSEFFRSYDSAKLKALSQAIKILE